MRPHEHDLASQVGAWHFGQHVVPGTAWRAPMARCSRSAAPAACSLSISFASGTDSAAAGTTGCAGSTAIIPVWATRSRSVPIERITSASAPRRAASIGPITRARTAGP